MDTQIILSSERPGNRSGEFCQAELESGAILNQIGGDVRNLVCCLIVGQIKCTQQVFFFFNDDINVI